MSLFESTETSLFESTETSLFESTEELFNLIPRKWRDICDEKIFKEQSWENIVNTLNNGDFYPTKENIFKCFRLLDPENVKVVIIGQDPYIRKDQAMGLSFSVQNGKDIPPSLKNVYREIFREYKANPTNEEINKLVKKFNKKGDLTKWATEGVLLLNTVLTVQPGKSNSHKNIGWEKFTKHILTKLDEKFKIVFMGWGKSAQDVLKDSVKYNQILKTGHPSPLNYSNPFVGSNCFKKCNIILEQKYNLKPVKWICLFIK